jgi:transcription factor MYB, plant
VRTRGTNTMIIVSPCGCMHRETNAFSAAVKPAKRRTASEVGFSDMFAVAPPGDWFGGGSTAPSPGPSSAVTDEEFNLEMQQFMSMLPLSDEHGWNA